MKPEILWLRANMDFFREIRGLSCPYPFQPIY